MASTQSQRVFDSLIYDQTVATAAASTTANIGTETDNKLVIQSNQPVEITRIEIFPSINTTTGATEDIEYVIPVINGNLFQGGALFRMRADLDSVFSTAPVLYRASGKKNGKFSRNSYVLGLSMRELLEYGYMANPQNILLNTTIKAKEKSTVDFQYTTGSTAATGTMRIRVWADRFTDGVAADNYVQNVYRPNTVGLPVAFSDHKSGRQFFSKIGVKYNGFRSDWEKLIGGDQIHLNDGISFKRFNYWARNSNATTVGSEYQLSSTNPSNVENQYENMDIQVDNKTLYVVNNLGVLDYSGNLRYVRIRANEQEMMQVRVDSSVDDVTFGRQTAIGGTVSIKSHQFFGLPEVGPILGHDEELQVTIQDSGAAIGAGSFTNGILAVWDGYLIQDPNLEGQDGNFLTGSKGGPKQFA